MCSIISLLFSVYDFIPFPSYFISQSYFHGLWFPSGAYSGMHKALNKKHPRHFRQGVFLKNEIQLI
jgi:hypothetical protein